MNNILKAIEFAKEAHKGQERKYTGEDYIWHPIEVATIVSEVEGCTEEMIVAAILHDTIEDCEVEAWVIGQEFGLWVQNYVLDLTDVSKPSDGNRAKRKEIDRLHTAKAHKNSKTIKLADLISNAQSICQYDKEFAKVYIKEKELLLEVLTEGDEKLYKKAQQIVFNAKCELVLE
jgi:(p)ppGpp synthase/HD superfamily hydrolase